MRKSLFFILAGSFIFAALLYIYKFNALQAITYFPLDTENTIAEAESELAFSKNKNKDSYDIIWNVASASSKPLYLRQDASLLFADGKLRGVRSKWKEDTADIQFEEKFPIDASRFFQVISYHHGEVHYPEDKIKSIHEMSRDNLYVVRESGQMTAFHSPADNGETAEKKALETNTQQQLLYHWNQLLAHFRIDKSSYTMVPLTGLYTYNEKKIPGLSRTETDQVIGQLWEGIYKNYIIPATDKQNYDRANYMPIVLFSNDQTHLLVLFELNGKKQKLIQQYR